MALLSLHRIRWIGLLIGILVPGRALAQEGARPEYEVKSAYLVNFLMYATWPPGALAPDGPLRLCILGDDPFGEFLQRASSDRTIQGHPLRVIQVDRVVEADRCHAGFIGERNRIPAEVWLERLNGRPVLTIGEGEAFLDEGGMITLLLDERTVRFDVSRSALLAAGLDLSSRVLRLARSEGRAR